MLSEDLFREILIIPAMRQEINRLQIVSGFATAGMADRHMEKLAGIDQSISIDLIIGMPRQVGIEKAQHFALRKLSETQPYGLDFSCRYVVKGNPVHAKTYCWFEKNRPILAFAGSANYSLTAFGRSQIEVMTPADVYGIANFQADVRRNTTDCRDEHIETKIALTETRQIADLNSNVDTVTLSLLNHQTKETPERSGINWGQREGRNKNQAYINIPADIGGSGFFPDRAEQFTVLTDDGDSFIMVRAQDGGKGLHTTQNNALLGEYLRARMRVPSGHYVTRQHLIEYGRTDITFTKIDDETYLLDFRPNMGPGEDAETWQA